MVFEHPVLRDLAARVDRQRHQPDGAEPVRFILPLAAGQSGRAIFFNEMDLKMAKAGRWRVPCPLYAISHWAQGEGFAKADTIQDLARRQIAGIRTLQPAGPYRIAGFSYGGLVALEIAHQLRDAGEEVEFLFLLDPMQPHRTTLRPGTNGGEGPDRPVGDTLGRRWKRHLRTLFTRPRDIPHYVSVRFFWHFAHNPLVQRLTYALVHLHGRNPNPVSEWLLPRNRWPAFWYSALRMAKTYVAKPYPGRVLAVFATGSQRSAVWRDILPPHAEIRTLPAEHGAMLDDPALGEWSDTLRPWVEHGPPPTR